jgi:hypothetical protein
MDQGKWEDVVDDGASHPCAIVTFIDQEEWHCPQEATRVLEQSEFDRLVQILKANTGYRVQVKHRSFCPTHQRAVVAHFLMESIVEIVHEESK